MLTAVGRRSDPASTPSQPFSSHGPSRPGLARDIPWDLGDSVLNAWILQWGADHWLRFLGGDLGAFRGYFNANIFYPEPLTLAYSEHLTAQVLQILPVYALTGNIVLSYNLLFLSTFVLSGLGTFLLVRELTGSARAGFVAGLLYAFAPYRIGQFSHVQVMSSQWMPFALYGFRRYFETRRPWPLAGAALALVAQNWSCGYFLLYFAPFAAAYVIYEIADRGLWKDLRVWASLGAAAAVVMGATVPLLLPYLELREHGFGPRPIGEVAHFSADVYSYLTAHEEQSFWGAIMRAFVKPEGELFPSLIAGDAGDDRPGRACQSHVGRDAIARRGSGRARMAPRGDLRRRPSSWRGSWRRCSSSSRAPDSTGRSGRCQSGCTTRPGR